MSLAELESSDDAVGEGPGIKSQREKAQRDKAEVLLERCAGGALTEHCASDRPCATTDSNTAPVHMNCAVKTDPGFVFRASFGLLMEHMLCICRLCRSRSVW